MTRKKTEPNYELLFKSAVTGLQNTYSQYKTAMTRALQYTWYGDDGNYAELDSAIEQRDKAHRLWYEVDRLKAQVEEYRNLMEGAEDAGRNE